MGYYLKFFSLCTLFYVHYAKKLLRISRIIQTF